MGHTYVRVRAHTHAAFQTPRNITAPPLLCIMCHSRALYLMTLSIHAHTSLNVNYTWPKGTGGRRAGGQERKKGDVFIKLNTRGGLSDMHARECKLIMHMHIYRSTRSSPFFLTGPLRKNESSVLSSLLSVSLVPRHAISHLVPAYNTAHTSWLAWSPHTFI